MCKMKGIIVENDKSPKQKWDKRFIYAQSEIVVLVLVKANSEQ